MTGLDTNILMRYLTQDDGIQTPIATRILEEELTELNPGFVSLVTIAELVWVLRTFYQWSGLEIADVLQRFLQADNIVFQNPQEVFTAVTVLKRGSGSFGDALIAGLGQWAGCTTTLTFDVKASRLDGFTRV